MASDKKISQLPPVSTPLTGDEEFPVVQSSTTKKATIADVNNGQVIPITNGSGSPYAMLASQSGAIITNEGAVALAVCNLPAASAGLGVKAYVQNANGLKFNAGTGDTIRNYIDVSSSGGYIQSTDLGASFELRCINATEWVVMCGSSGIISVG